MVNEKVVSVEIKILPKLIIQCHAARDNSTYRKDWAYQTLDDHPGTYVFVTSGIPVAESQLPT